MPSANGRGCGGVQALPAPGGPAVAEGEPVAVPPDAADGGYPFTADDLDLETWPTWGT